MDFVACGLGSGGDLPTLAGRMSEPPERKQSNGQNDGWHQKDE